MNGREDLPVSPAERAALEREIRALQERVAFYEGFDHLIQDNVAQARELFRLAAQEREAAANAADRTRLAAGQREAVYRAFTNERSLEEWLAPPGKTGSIHDFTPGVGGGYKMELVWMEPGSDRGEGYEQEDHYTTRFVDLVPEERVVMSINFETPEHRWAGEMTMTVVLHAIPEGTLVTVDVDDLPSGITAEDNDAGVRAWLDRLARHLE